MTNPGRLIEEKPSKTAKIVCYMRALAYAEVGPPVANDHLAQKFLSPAVRQRIQSAAERQTIFADEIQPHNYSYLTARTRHLDKWVQHALEHQFPQIVFLGAGYDSRSYRFAERLGRDTRLFEVDAPTTQGAKLKFLKLAEIEAPEGLTFVSIDFTKASLEDVLPAAGYDPSKKTLFIWEGVSYYITAEAVDSTLAFVHNRAGAESVIAFDYIYEPVARKEFNYLGAEQAYQAVADEGEPFIFGIPDGEIGRFLSDRGFELIEHFTPAEFHETYLDDRFPQPYGFMVNAVARSK